MSAAFDPVDFLERAVRTPSHEDVGPMCDLLVAELDRHGAAAEMDDADNVIATRGAGSPHVILNTHLDTVPPHVPFERDGDVVRGRGSCDAKGPLAALVSAFLGAVPPGRLTLAVTPDEERLSTGAAALDLQAFGDPPDAVIVGEPTGLDTCNAARGRFEATVTIDGESAHAAKPDSGVNAVAAAASVLAALTTFDAEHGPGDHRTLGLPSLTPTVISGGEATNQVPDRCEVVVDRRSVPPETADGFRGALESHLRAAAPPGVTVTVTLTERGTPFLEAFATPEDDPLVEALLDAGAGAVRPFAAATEASYFAAVAPTVVFGPGVLADDEGAVAHADREYVRLPDVLAAADTVRGAVEALVG